GARARRTHRRELPHRGTQLPPARSRGGRVNRRGSLEADERADVPRLRERRLDRGRHRVRREAQAGLEEHLTKVLVKAEFRIVGVNTPTIRPWSDSGSKNWPAGPTSRSTQSASTKSVACWRPPRAKAASAGTDRNTSNGSNASATCAAAGSRSR